MSQPTPPGPAGRPPIEDLRALHYPFGGGPRLCIGAHFAAVEAGLIIAATAQRFYLHRATEQQVAIEPSVTLRPRHGLLMTLHARR